MEEKDNFKFLYKMCMKEHKKASAHLECLAKLLSDDAAIVDGLPTELTALYLKAYDDAFSRLTSVADLIRKFNIQVQLNDLVDINKYSCTNRLYDSNENHETLPGGPQQGSEMPFFEVAQPYLGDYRIGFEGKAIVCHVKSYEENLFYIVNTSNLVCNLFVDLNNYLDSPRESMTTLPKPGVVFGLFFREDDSFNRVVAENNIKPNSTNFRVYFLDTGEVMEVSNDLSRFYELPTKFQTVAPQAVLCKLHKLIQPENQINPMQSLMHQTIVFKVVSIDSNVIGVNVTLSTAPMLEVQPPTEQLTTKNIVPLQNIVAPLPQFNSKNPFAMDLLLESIEPQAETKAANPATVATNDLTPDQRRQLFEDTGCTNNAMVAVMGYNPKDDQRICRFYDPKTGGCFKGSNCRLEHVPKLKDGWTRDQMVSKTYTRIDMPQPKIGTDIKMIPTHVVGTNLFYAQLTINLPKIKEINYRINSNEYMNSYKPLRYMPGPLELVLATYTDGKIYRAQVREINEQQVLVYYVDYGNIRLVQLSDIYLWDDRFDALPFQAYPCRLDNVNGKEDTPQTAERFRELVLNREMKAHIHFNREELFVTLTDEEGFDVGESLCSMGLAEHIPNSIRAVLHTQRH